MKTDSNDPLGKPDPRVPGPPWDSAKLATVGLFVLALIYTAFYAKPILLPLILALLATLVLKPVHRFMVNRRVPGTLAALLVVFSLIGILGAGVYRLQTPAAEWAQKINPDIVRIRIERFFTPLREFRSDLANAASKVQELTTGEPESPGASTSKSGSAEKSKPPVAVEVVQNPLSHVVTYAQTLTTHLAITLLLTLLFLAFGDALNQNLAGIVKDSEVLRRIGSAVSRYLFTTTMINIGLGAVIGSVLALLGFPNPLLCGVMAALFNFVPYLGALAGTTVVFLLSVASSTDPVKIALPPLAYFLITSIEGNLVTPAIMGRRFVMNPIIIFLWLASWSILWGTAGTLIAMPMLMAFRIVCREVPSLWRLDRLINGETPPPPSDIH